MSWSYWVIFGLGLLVFEILTPGGFFTFFFGVSAFVVAILVWLGVLESGSGQWLVFAILGIGLLAVLRPVVRKRFESNTPKVDQLVGETAIALEDLDENGRGKVELRGTSWSALYKGSDRILKGDRLRVTKVDGLSLKVERE
jgi:membrane protein implicated in regulation of membrane protease activity